MNENLLDEYKRRIKTNKDDVLIHKARETLIGDLYTPIGERSLDQYYSDLIKHMNTRVLLNPQSAVGGDWDEASIHQLNIMKSLGLKPSNTLLDFGCGTLRAGRLLIDYLNQGKYTGVDISPEALNFARWLANECPEWGTKDFDLILNDDPENVVIPISNDTKFDYIISFWVCYDMPEKIFRQFLHEAIDHMHEDSVFVFTWVRREETYPATNKMFTWLHSSRIVDEVVEERGVDHTELPIQLHPEDEQIVSCFEFL